MGKPSIVVSMPVVWGVRNVVRSGLYDALSQRFRVILAIPPEGKLGLLKEGFPEKDLFVLTPASNHGFHNQLRRLLRSAHKRRHPTQSDKIFGNWSRRKGDIRGKTQSLVYDGMSGLATTNRIFDWLKRREADSFRDAIASEVWAFLETERPIAGLSTSCIVDWEWPLFRAMADLKIPVAAHVLSFDNVTSRGYLPFDYFDRYFVWQKRMAEELKLFYEISPDKIVVTGTPQFDFHVREDFRWSREYTTKALTLKANKPYFVYCANHAAITPREPELVAAIIKEFTQDGLFAEYQWVVRLHPMDRYERWDQLAGELDSVRIIYPWKQAPNAAFWGMPSKDDLALLGNTLRHASATLTVASSTALDSAVVGTPIVCVGFHPDGHSKEDRFYYDAHYSHHFLPTMKSGAVRLATRMELLREYLLEAIRSREALLSERCALVRRICGLVDGNAGDRIADGMLDLVTANRNESGIEAVPRVAVEVREVARASSV